MAGEKLPDEERRWSGFSKRSELKENPVVRRAVDTVQINIGKLCNQVCLHCHVDAGPHKQKENMGKEAVDRILELLGGSGEVKTVDVTGGAPELNPHFRRLVLGCRKLGIGVIDRCNLTVLFEPGQENTAEFLAEYRVKVIASLPCYSRKNVEKQRGDGVFDKSIKGLQKLNQLGYGLPEQGLSLDLVYNPVGPALPPPQENLEKEYKIRLREDFSIHFNRLLTLTNMPVKRFLFDLKKNSCFHKYMNLLSDHFNADTLDQVMCRDLISVSWDGRIFDCDFNQMLQLPAGGTPKTIWDIESFSCLVRQSVMTANHCYGCTAGAGSSCGGTIS